MLKVKHKPVPRRSASGNWESDAGREHGRVGVGKRTRFEACHVKAYPRFTAPTTLYYVVYYVVPVPSLTTSHRKLLSSVTREKR